MTEENFRPLDSLQVMAYIIERSQALNININVTKLQKLMYCCYGVLLAEADIRLSEESPEAWQYGPVFPKPLKLLKKLTINEFVSVVGTRSVVVSLPQNAKEAIDKTLRFFGRYTANQLSMWSHLEGSPWSRASNKGKDLYGQIDDQSIRAYFSTHVIGSIQTA